jgi:serine/threonine protein kinase
LDFDEATKYFTDLMYALQYVHFMGVVHRDIKDENIMISKGNAILIDFGVSTISVPKTTIGSFTYMAPEMITGQHSSEENTFNSKIDVFSLGKTMY